MRDEDGKAEFMILRIGNAGESSGHEFGRLTHAFLNCWSCQHRCHELPGIYIYYYYKATVARLSRYSVAEVDS